MTYRNLRQDLANFSRQSVRDLSVSALEETYSKVVAQRREADERAEHELNLNIPHIQKVQRLLAQQLEDISNEENAHLPVTSVFDALQIVKSSKNLEHDIGLRVLKGMLENQWKKNREASISAASYVSITDHFKRNYPRSEVVDVLQEIGRKGYMVLECSKLAELAEEVGSQEDYERIILENGLQSNVPHCKKARQFILALVNGDSESHFERRAQEEDELEEEPFELQEDEDIWQDDHSGGYHAEVRGLYDPDKEDYEVIKLGVFGSREEAEKALLKSRENEFANKSEEEFDSEMGKYDSPLAKDLWEKSQDSSWYDDEVGSTSEGPGTWAALFKDEKAILYSDSQGFISVDEFDDESSLMQHWEMLQKELAFDPFDEGEEDSEESDEETLV